MTVKSLTQLDLEKIREKLDALSEENRFVIVGMLFAAGKPIPYSHLLKICNLTSPSLSFHLKKLLNAGLIRKIEVEKRKRGKPYIYYEITEEGKEVLKALGVAKAEKVLREWFWRGYKKVQHLL